MLTCFSSRWIRYNATHRKEDGNTITAISTMMPFIQNYLCDILEYPRMSHFLYFSAIVICMFPRLLPELGQLTIKQFLVQFFRCLTPFVCHVYGWMPANRLLRHMLYLGGLSAKQADQWGAFLSVLGGILLLMVSLFTTYGLKHCFKRGTKKRITSEKTVTRSKPLIVFYNTKNGKSHYWL